MTDENILRINTLLKDAGDIPEINSLSELKAFLGDSKNKKLEVYDEIEELYDILMLGAGMW
jgi:hypothetical protein